MIDKNKYKYLGSIKSPEDVKKIPKEKQMV